MLNLCHGNMRRSRNDRFEADVEFFSAVPMVREAASPQQKPHLWRMVSQPDRELERPFKYHITPYNGLQRTLLRALYSALLIPSIFTTEFLSSQSMLAAGTYLLSLCMLELGSLIIAVFALMILDACGQRKTV